MTSDLLSLDLLEDPAAFLADTANVVIAASDAPAVAQPR